MKNLHAQFGDITRFTVTLNGKDITEAVANVYISQELTNPFTTAVLDIADTTNMITRYNIRPNATVDIKLNIKQEVDTECSSILRRNQFGRQAPNQPQGHVLHAELHDQGILGQPKCQGMRSFRRQTPR